MTESESCTKAARSLTAGCFLILPKKKEAKTVIYMGLLRISP